MSDEELVRRLRDASTEALQAAWRRTDGGQDLALGAILAEQAADRIEELERKLHKAVSILQDAKQMCVDGHPVSAFNLASMALAELSSVSCANLKGEDRV